MRGWECKKILVRPKQWLVTQVSFGENWGQRQKSIEGRRRGPLFRSGRKPGVGGFVIPPPHVDRTWDSHAIDPGGRLWWRGTGEIRDIIYTGNEVGSVSGRRVPREGKQPTEAQGTLHVLALEVKCVDYTGWNRILATILSLWNENSRESTGEA